MRIKKKNNADVSFRFGDSVVIHRGGHEAPAPGQYRYVRATYVGAIRSEVLCRLEQDDPDYIVGWNKKGMIGLWSRSAMLKNVPIDAPSASV